MRLPIQAPAVIREAFHWPADRLFPGLVPSGQFTSGHIQAMRCFSHLCRCPGTYSYACCQKPECHWDGAKCACT
jgi:hypothetical protein